MSEMWMLLTLVRVCQSIYVYADNT